MDVALIITLLFNAIFSGVLILYIYRQFTARLVTVDRMLDVAQPLLADENARENLSTAIEALKSVGEFALTAQTILSEEELLEGLLTTIAQKAVKIFQYSIMGGKSGDSKKRAKAEQLVTEAVVEGAKKLNPVLGMALKVTGLDEELKNDPDMLGYIMEFLSENGGVMNMLSGQIQSLPTVEEATEQAGKGVDF